MAKHLHTGKEGEQLAAVYLQEHGYEVLEKNWRFSHWEVDVIASKDQVLHFIEVKTRRSNSFGRPEEKVGNKKIKFLINAAEQYIYQHPQWQRIQFDILAITIPAHAPVVYFLLEDVYL